MPPKMKEIQTILKNDHVKLEFFPSEKKVIQTWNDYVPSYYFREAIDKTVQFAEQNEVHRILSNALEQKVVSHEDAEYAASNLLKLHSAGVKAMAFVIPKNVFTKISLKKFEQREYLKITQYFHTIESANEWLDSM
jgi:hypothetical protein